MLLQWHTVTRVEELTTLTPGDFYVSNAGGASVLTLKIGRSKSCSSKGRNPVIIVPDSRTYCNCPIFALAAYLIVNKANNNKDIVHDKPLFYQIPSGGASKYVNNFLKLGFKKIDSDVHGIPRVQNSTIKRTSHGNRSGATTILAADSDISLMAISFRGGWDNNMGNQVIVIS